MFGIKRRVIDAAATAPILQRLANQMRSRENLFDECYSQHLWGSTESGSGSGSELSATVDLRAYLPELFERLGVGTFLDAPCGDWNWMRLVDLERINYIGADIVPRVIASNRAHFSRDGVRFVLTDLTRGKLPRSDLILCRDCWAHLSFHDISAMLENFRRSGATWLLVSDTPSVDRNHNKFTGAGWRHLNLGLAPFHFPPAIERHKDHHADVPFQISLWRIADLPSLRLP